MFMATTPTVDLNKVIKKVGRPTKPSKIFVYLISRLTQIVLNFRFRKVFPESYYGKVFSHMFFFSIFFVGLKLYGRLDLRKDVR